MRAWCRCVKKNGTIWHSVERIPPPMPNQSPIITIKQTPGKTNPVLCDMIRLHVAVTQSCRVWRGTSIEPPIIVQRAPNYHQNLMRSSVAPVPPFHRVLWKSVAYFLHNPANKQANEQTKQSENMTSSAEVIRTEAAARWDGSRCTSKQ